MNTTKLKNIIEEDDFEFIRNKFKSCLDKISEIYTKTNSLFIKRNCEDFIFCLLRYEDDDDKKIYYDYWNDLKKREGLK